MKKSMLAAMALVVLALAALPAVAAATPKMGPFARHVHQYPGKACALGRVAMRSKQAQ